MSFFVVHTLETAPKESKDILESFQKKYGFLPDILKIMAGSPSTLKAYMALSAEIAQGTLSPLEQHIVQITTNRLNHCRYCIATHSKIAKEAGLDFAVIDAVRQDKPIADEKFESLRQFTKSLVAKAGRVNEADMTAFVRAGYTREQAMEVVTSVARKMLSNYIAHVVQPAFDEALEPFVIDLPCI